MNEQRTLTAADVKAIADAVEKSLEAKFYDNLGRGLWGLAWKALVSALLFIAAYGVIRSKG